MPSPRPAHPRNAVARLLAVLALLCCGGLALGGVAHAADETTWGIAPANADGADGRSALEVVADPGQSVSEHVEIRNIGTSTVVLQVYAADGSTGIEGVYDLLSDGEDSTDAGSWTTLDTDTVTLEPRERRVVTATIAVPADASPGDHAAGIVAVLRSQGGGADNSVLIDRRVGTRLHVRVTGPVEPQLAVTMDAPALRRPVNPFAPGTVTTTVTVQNTGNIRLVGDTRLEVAGPFGIAATGSPDLVVPELQPGDSYATTISVPGVAQLGLLSVDAHAWAVSSGDQNVTGSVPEVSASARLWAISWAWLLLPVAGAGWWWWRRRRRRRV